MPTTSGLHVFMNIINICQIQANPTCRYRQVEKKSIRCNIVIERQCIIVCKKKSQNETLYIHLQERCL